MKVKIIEEAKVICSNRNSIHNYFAWPTVTKLQDGTLAMVASGFRMRHICPFGKGIICYSRDEGTTWSRPEILIDTPLDDRDCGILAYGDKNVIVTSFNNTIEVQRHCVKEHEKLNWRNWQTDNPYIDAYLNTIESQGLEDEYIGSTYVLSNDGGYTFGDVRHCDISTPHGPAVLNDGRVIYIGRTWNKTLAKSWPPINDVRDRLECHIMSESGDFEFVSAIDDIFADGERMLSCEPHTIVLPNGKILVHIRVQSYTGGNNMCIFQCDSCDDGKTFTKPRQITEFKEGGPSHILRRSDGTLIGAYGHRFDPCGIRIMVSCDDGKSWETGIKLYNTIKGDDDLGYPSSVELSDGSILTVFYAHKDNKSPSEIMQIIWRLE